MRLPLSLFATLTLGCGQKAPATQPEPAAPLPTGQFLLTLETDAPWHRNTLTLDAAARSGVVVIDRGIGPEGRAPSPDEILHEVPFVAEDAAQHLVFSVTIGTLNRTAYRFELWPCPEAGATHCTGDARLQGTARVDGQTVRATAHSRPAP